MTCFHAAQDYLFAIVRDPLPDFLHFNQFDFWSAAGGDAADVGGARRCDHLVVEAATEPNHPPRQWLKWYREDDGRGPEAVAEAVVHHLALDGRDAPRCLRRRFVDTSSARKQSALLKTSIRL